MDRISIPEAVDELRRDIAEAQRRYQDGDLAFEIVEIELALQGTLTRTVDKDGNATVKFTVLGFGVEGGGGIAEGTASGASHTVKLTLQVADPAAPGKRAQIRRETTGTF